MGLGIPRARVMLALAVIGCGGGDAKPPADAALVDDSGELDAALDAAACDPSQATCACDNGACAGGLTCVGGLCIDACNFSYECGPGAACADGACVSACSAGSPCSPGYRCVGGGCLPDPANPACSASNPCPTGATCGASGLCAMPCTTTSQCGGGEVCDGTSQRCIRDPSIKPTCDASTPCPGGQECLADGFCHVPCTMLSDCSIDARFVACDDVCKTNAEVNPQCTLQTPCSTGMSCVSNACF